MKRYLLALLAGTTLSFTTLVAAQVTHAGDNVSAEARSTSAQAMPASLTPTQVVEGFIHAYNQHSVEQMLNYTSDTIKWMHVSGIKLDLETSNQAEFGAAMTDYFETLKDANATIVSIIASGNYVSTVERVTWRSDGELHSQCSIGNFRIEAGKLAELWYLPAHVCDDALVVEQSVPESQAATASGAAAQKAESKKQE